MTTSHDCDIPNSGTEDEYEFGFDPIINTNVGEFLLYVCEEIFSFSMEIIGHVIPNKCGTP